MQLTQKDNTEENILENFSFVSNDRCKICSTQLVLNMEHDSYYCPKCNKWTESECKDPKCNYCKNRPEKPL